MFFENFTEEKRKETSGMQIPRELNEAQIREIKSVGKTMPRHCARKVHCSHNEVTNQQVKQKKKI